MKDCNYCNTKLIIGKMCIKCKKKIHEECRVGKICKLCYNLEKCIYCNSLDMSINRKQEISDDLQNNKEKSSINYKNAINNNKDIIDNNRDIINNNNDIDSYKDIIDNKSIKDNKNIIDNKSITNNKNIIDNRDITDNKDVINDYYLVGDRLLKCIKCNKKFHKKCIIDTFCAKNVNLNDKNEIIKSAMKEDIKESTDYINDTKSLLYESTDSHINNNNMDIINSKDIIENSKDIIDNICINNIINNDINENNDDCNLKLKNFEKRKIKNDKNYKKLKTRNKDCLFKELIEKSEICLECCKKLMIELDINDIVKLNINPFSEINNNKIINIKEKIYEKEIKKIIIGNIKMNVNYFSPFSQPSEKIYICEICLDSFNEKYSYKRHKIKCDKEIPGIIIYNDNDEIVKQVDGAIDTLFCRNLCLIAKCFLENKTLYYDVELFLFYVLYKNNRIIGYFSKEKYCVKYNLSCIVILPEYQGLGYGYFLVDLSYKLSKYLGRLGSPEKPLSNSGLRLYKKYWVYKVYNTIKNLYSLKLKSIANITGMTVNDILFALEILGFIKKEKEYFIKFELRNIKNIKSVSEDFIKYDKIFNE